MSLAKITLFGMYRWMKESEDNLFEELSLPDLMENDTLIKTILAKGAEFEVLYGDPEFMKNMIGIWSDRWYNTLDRWAKALAIEYNPLENYDRMEEWTDAGSKNKTGSGSTESNSASSNTITNTESQKDTGRSSGATTDEGSGTNNTEHKVSAFDSSAYQPEGKDENNTTSHSSSASTNYTDNDRSIDGHTNAINTSTAQSNNTNAENEENMAAHVGRTHGNIGVLTSQAMLQSELDVARFSLYDEAADLFLQEFCIYTY